MNLDKCEEIILSAMAEIDGEPPTLPAEETARHLVGCEPCRAELRRQTATAGLLKRQMRRSLHVDMWPEIERRIGAESIFKPNEHRPFFFLLGALLVSFKLLEMMPAEDLGFLFKLVPLILVVTLFYFIKENPFKINTELELEGSWK